MPDHIAPVEALCEGLEGLMACRHQPLAAEVLEGLCVSRRGRLATMISIQHFSLRGKVRQLEGDHVVKQWAVPIVVAVIGAMLGGPIVGLLAGILAALVWPSLSGWWIFRRYARAIEMQNKFLEEYDVCAISPADYEGMRLATLGETDPNTAVLLDRKAIREAKLIYPTKAKTAADKKAAWDNEEERRRSLGFPSQSVRRDYKAEWPYYKPHYQHLKEGIKVTSCWLCDQNNAEQDQQHREIWGRVEREEAEKNRTVGNA
jgi:hypothetical protein